jgi:hypothetical protein
MGKINKEWHLAHRMPKKITHDQRIIWHIEHTKNCQCRGIPPKLLAEIEKRKIFFVLSPDHFSTIISIYDKIKSQLNHDRYHAAKSYG